MRKNLNDAREIGDNKQEYQPIKDEIMRERMVENSINITFEKYRYTAPLTIEFVIRKIDHTINLPHLHREFLLIKIKLVEPTAKIFSNKGTIYNNPKKIH